MSAARNWARSGKFMPRTAIVARPAGVRPITNAPCDRPRSLPDVLGQRRVLARSLWPVSGSALQQFARLRFQNGQHVADTLEVVDLKLLVWRERAFLRFLR